MSIKIQASGKSLFIARGDNYFCSYWNKTKFYVEDRVNIREEGNDYIIIESADRKKIERWNILF